MLTIDWVKFHMVEIAHSILTIMAIEACRTEFILVLCHKISILFGMAENTGLLVEGLDVRNVILVEVGVAVGTYQRSLLVCLGMVNEAEAGEGIVIKCLIIQYCRLPAICGVAYGTIISEQAEMRIRFFMTGDTILGGGFKIGILVAA